MPNLTFQHNNMQIKHYLFFSLFTLYGAMSVGHACGPWLPEPYLTRNDDFFYAPPMVGFNAELEYVLPESSPHSMVWDDEMDYADDLRAALKNGGHSVSDQQSVIDSYQAFRNALDAAKQYLDEQVFEYYTPAVDEGEREAALADLAALTVPGALPLEFQYYLKGAFAYYGSELAAARVHWQAVLDLPVAQRHYRSTWAAYMLAKTGVGDSVVEAYQRVRDLTADGFADSAGLAAASYGREAQFYLHNGHYAEAIDLYLQQWGTGYFNAVCSLKITAGRAFSNLRSGAELEALAADPNSRAVLTAYLLDASRADRSQEQRCLWLRALPDAKAFTLKEAGRFALLEYQLNDLDACRRWLKYASADDALALWISSKLMLRDGNIAAGQTLMLALTKQMEHDAENPDWRRIDTNDAWGELGLLMLSQERYVDAANAFLNADSWEDLAYVLERLLTTDELLVWLATCDEQVRDDHNHVQGSGAHLLTARRLMREAKFEQALELFDAETGAVVQAYLLAMRQANDATLSASEKAKYYWQAALITREWGLQIFGAELAPDYAWFGGSYSFMEDFTETRETQRYTEGYYLNQTSWDETERAEQTKIQPNKRFHYRYRAARLAELAAGLLPNDDENAARIYCVAGSWIKNRDPDAADRLFKQLVVRCPNTELGKAALEVNWFPLVEIEDIEPFVGMVRE